MAPEQPEKIDSMINRAFGSCVIREKIAVGGFGTVYKAIDERLGIPRAIKIFHPHLSEEQGFRKRFEIEMRLLAHLDHSNIVRIISAIDNADASGFIMEYVEGKTLNEIVEEEGALPISKAIDIFSQVARSIAYAHNLEHQIIHRDLSPDNIMIRPDGIVKIMDFGIAKTIGSEKVTQTGIVLGKPTYMAPEQFEGTVSIYTDQYALGVILYEMVTGRVPFDAESPIALYKLHLNEKPTSPREINEQIPLNVETVILKSLAKEEKDRYKNIDEMIEVLLNKKGVNVDNKVPALMRKVEEAIKNEDFDRALEDIQEVLQYDSKNKEALTKREEIIALKKIHMDQDLIEEWFHQAQAFHESKMEEETCKSIVNFLKITSQYLNSKTIQRYIKNLQRKMPDVFVKAKAIVEKDEKKAEELTRTGKLLYQQDKFNEALNSFDEALEIFPYSDTLQKLKKLALKKIKMAKMSAFYRDGILALKHEDYPKAIKAFEQVLQLNPQHKDAKKYREMAQLELDKISKTRTELEATYREAMDLYEKWEFTQAIGKFQRVLELDEEHPEAQKLLAESMSRVADENKIEELGFFYNQGLTFYKSQQWEKALTCFNRVLKYMDSHKGALEYRQLAKEKIAQHGQVEAAFQEALEHFRNSQYTRALEKLDYILAIDKNHKGARQYRALCNELHGLADETSSGLTLPDQDELHVPRKAKDDETSEDSLA